MGKERTGFVQFYRGGWWARVSYTDDKGKRRELWRKAKSEAHAKSLLRSLVAELGKVQATAETIKTFDKLADYYESKFLFAAEYVGHRKVAGRRSLAGVKGHLKTLRAHFHKKKIETITYGDVFDFRAERLKTPTIHLRQRSIAAVNRELELLRAVLNCAVREGWLIKNPFNAGSPLISKADEVQRTRVLSYDEEARLLAQCVGLRAHLRAIIICAVDTGMRRGELLSLKWPDVDFENERITIRAMNTKTQTQRAAIITERMKVELLQLRKNTTDESGRVFGVADVKKSFGGARRAAGLVDLRFHDLRHTTMTRLLEGGLTIAEAMKILGHTQPQTAWRYYSVSDEALEKAKRVLTGGK